MFEADITKVVEEMSVRIRETEEDFILDTIFPYCQETLQRKINKAELKQIVLRGSRPKGKWIIKDGKEQGYDIAGIKTWYIQILCDKCGFIKTAIEGHTGQYHYCPNCGAEMSGGGEDDE